MVVHYSARTWSILLGMIFTGAARSIVVKLAYQSGFMAPLTITLLYLFGQGLSLLVYFGSRTLQDWRWRRTQHDDTTTVAANNTTGTVELHPYFATVDAAIIHPNDSFADVTPVIHPADSFVVDDTGKLSKLGSVHGLTHESAERVRWIHSVPFWAKPLIPALFNLLNSALRWAALVYVDASVTEMMISGLELVLSVVAARIFRHRLVSKSRWAGVFIVTMGVLIVEWADMEEAFEVGEVRDTTVGVILIVLQSVLSVLQDIAEEIFMQAADFPATMMLGMEGCYGFAVGLVIYLSLGNRFGIEDIDATRAALTENATLRWWLVGLPVLFLITGVFNIKATEVTSAMTRNVWKNFRTTLVWVTALGVFYLGNNQQYGEEWHVPESFWILLGFGVMFVGVVVYYFYKEQEQKTLQKPLLTVAEGALV
ncbi:hypothetical protein ACHAXT_011344 [Thalassiosira profunda]